MSNTLPLKKKCLLHIDFLGFYNLVGIQSNTKFLEKYFFEYVEKNFCKKFITPTLNYQFCKTQITSNKSKSELSGISEYFRKKLSKSRSFDPIFSFCRNYKQINNIKNTLRSFDENSAITEIIKDDGFYFFCGTPISFITPGIHFLENLISTPYRYDKIFKGIYKFDNKKIKIKYTYKVWPKINKSRENEYLVDSRYDSKKINKDLIKAGVMNVISYKHENYLMYCKAREFNSFIISKINKDPFYPLDKKTKLWMKPMLRNLKRGFEISDFE